MPQMPNDQPNNINNLKNDIKNAFTMMKGKSLALNTKRIQGENQNKENKNRLLQQMFALMADNGVDFNNMESINNFLRRLDENDPDLRELFENAFNALINDGDVNPQASMGEVAPEAGLMNRNLTQEQMMPRE